MIVWRRQAAGLFLVLAVGGCAAGGGPSPQPSASHVGIAGTAVAGPVCPVEKAPPDPSCAPRPVAGAVIIARNGSGAEAGRATTADEGTFFITVAAGSYQLRPQPVAGVMNAAPGPDVVVVAGAPSDVTVIYDTGIRGPAPAPSI